MRAACQRVCFPGPLHASGRGLTDVEFCRSWQNIHHMKYTIDVNGAKNIVKNAFFTLTRLVNCGSIVGEKKHE